MKHYLTQSVTREPGRFFASAEFVSIIYRCTEVRKQIERTLPAITMERTARSVSYERDDIRHFESCREFEDRGH